MAFLARAARLVFLLAGVMALMPATLAAQAVQVVEGSVYHQNVQTALKFLREHGDKQAADEIQRRLDEGKIYVNPKTEGNGTTDFATGQIDIDDSIAGNTRTAQARETPFDYDRDFASVTGLARTLYHENEHSTHQGYWYDVFMRRDASEHFAWTKTIRKLEEWIRLERDQYFDRFYQPASAGMTIADNRRELNRIAIKIRSLTEYTDQYRTTHKYFGYNNDKEWVQSIDDYWKLELNTYVTPELEKLQPSSPAAPAQPQTPAGTPPTSPPAQSAPAPKPSSQLIPCKECQAIAAQVADLREKGKQAADASEAARNKRDSADRRVTDLQRKAEGISRELSRAAGTGGSSYDPATGQTIDSHDQGDGTVKITTRDASGKVTDERTRDASARKAERAKELEKTNAEIEQAKSEAGKAAEAAEAATIAEMNLMDQMEHLVRDLEDCIRKYCQTASTADTLNMLGLPYAQLDTLSNPLAFNPFTGATNDLTQTMMIEIRAGDADGISVPGNRGAPSRGALEDLRQPRALLAALWSWLRPSRPFASLWRGFMIEPSRERWTQPRGGAPSRAESPVQMLLTSLGESTGQAFNLQIFNNGNRPFRLSADALVVEPLKDEVKKQMQAGMQRLMSSAASPVTAKLNGYCLEFLKLPPSPGALFRIAAPELQKRFAPVRNIMQASRKLQELGQLHPDSSPDGYFHSIRQWAMWTTQERFTDKTFGNAFVEYTKKNLAAQKRPWTNDIEAIVRKAVPNRWADIQRILTAATQPQ